QRVGGVTGNNRHCALDDNGAAIELCRHEMDGHAAHFYAVVDRLLLGVEPRERGQQRWMDVEDAVGERLDERHTDQAHEAGEADEPDVTGAQLPYESAVICVAGRKGAMRETNRLDPGH